MASSYSSLEKEQEKDCSHSSSPASSASIADGERASSSSKSPRQEGKVPLGVGRRPRNPAVLILWIEEHAHNPYPSKPEKAMLAHYAGMTQRQLNDWFANARRNIKKVGYSAWKDKHPAYSAYFSLGTATGNAPRALSSGQSNVPAKPRPSPVVPDSASTNIGVGPGGNRLKILTHNCPRKEKPSSKMSMGHPFSPYLAPHTSFINGPRPSASVSHSALPQVALAPATPTAYYKLQPPIPALGLGAMNQPLLPSQFNMSTFHNSSPWGTTTTSSATRGSTLHPEKLHIDSTSLKTELPDVSTSSAVVSPSLQADKNGGSESLNPVSQMAVTPESTWDATLPQSTAAQQLYTDFPLASSQTRSQLGLGGHWLPTSSALSLYRHS